ncbi:lysosome membrane protein 2-like isoform X2 [Amphiura filiformis]|uniref:lysosome membrane protein 2-like isoform X2 n=1 Tax=Amphiura filiformis TaxID=82378 RepID=UPI003B20FBF7
MSGGALVVGAVLGAVMIVLGGVFFPVFDKIIHDQVVKQVVLYNTNSTGFGEWKSPPGDIYMQFWFFTLANKAEVQDGAKPYFAEVGPFTYKEHKPKGNITFSADKNTVNYTSPNSYEFIPDMSVADPDYKITTINIPLLTVADQLKFLPSFLQKLVLEFLESYEHEEIFYEVSIHDILWGYEDPMLVLLAKVAPSLVPETTFGIFVGRNGSNDGVYQVYTGKNDPMQISNIVSWKGMTKLEWWTTDEANAINGSDGSYNHPFWNKDDDAYVFSSDICRSIIVKYEQETRTRGIRTWKFSAPSYSMLNGTAYPPNAGFCLPDIDHCLPSGLLNVSKCQLGAPIIMSLPHFLFADEEKVIDQVYGVRPDIVEHNTYFNVEPLTGAPLEVAKRIQINIFMEKNAEIDQMKNLRTLTFPLLWLNESATITVDGANSLKKSLSLPLLITECVKWGLIGLGAVVLIICSACFIRRRSPRVRSLSDTAINTSNGDLSETTPILR